MKPRSMPASPSVLPASVRQLQLLLFSLLTCGFLLALPSLAATTAHVFQSNAAGSDRAERLFASDPFLVTANDLLRTLRGDDSDRTDDDSGDQPVLSGTFGDTFQPVTLAIAVAVSNLACLPPLPVSTLPGAPRAPPVLPL